MSTVPCLPFPLHAVPRGKRYIPPAVPPSHRAADWSQGRCRFILQSQWSQSQHTRHLSLFQRYLHSSVELDSRRSNQIRPHRSTIPTGLQLNTGRGPRCHRKESFSKLGNAFSLIMAGGSCAVCEKEIVSNDTWLEVQNSPPIQWTLYLCNRHCSTSTDRSADSPRARPTACDRLGRQYRHSARMVSHSIFIPTRWSSDVHGSLATG